MKQSSLALGIATLSLALAAAGVGAKTQTQAKAKPPAKTASAKGDVKAGAKLFAKKFPGECRACHKFGKDGVGNDLTHVGSKRSVAYIKTYMQNPKKLNPKSIMPPVKGSDKELTDMAAFLATQK